MRLNRRKGILRWFVIAPAVVLLVSCGLLSTFVAAAQRSIVFSTGSFEVELGPDKSRPPASATGDRQPESGNDDIVLGWGRQGNWACSSDGPIVTVGNVQLWVLECR
jgi:hypothetical protein